MVANMAHHPIYSKRRAAKKSTVAITPVACSPTRRMAALLVSVVALLLAVAVAVAVDSAWFPVALSVAVEIAEEVVVDEEVEEAVAFSVPHSFWAAVHFSS